MLLISNNLLIEIRFKTACDSFHCDRNKKKVSRNLTVIKVVVGRPISFMFTGRRIVEAERYLQLPFSSTFKSSRLLRTVSSWVLWISKDEGSTASLGSLWHCLTTLTVRKSVIFFCLFVYTESPVLQFVSIPLVLPSSSIFFVPAHSHIFKIPQVLFLQAEQTWLSASPHRTDAPVPQLPPHPPVCSLHSAPASPGLGAPRHRHCMPAECHHHWAGHGFHPWTCCQCSA